MKSIQLEFPFVRRFYLPKRTKSVLPRTRLVKVPKDMDGFRKPLFYNDECYSRLPFVPP